jgi:DNA-directed RNA polymerase specialized sigma24 family protein
VLAKLTRHQACDVIRRQRAKKRGGGKVRDDSARPVDSDGDAAQWADLAVDSSPNPAEQAANAELCAHTMVQLCEKLFPQLSPEEQRTVAFVVEHGIRQPAKTLDRPESTIRVRYKKIVKTLKQAAESEP